MASWEPQFFFGWIDFSEDDRNSVRDWIKMFEEEEARDELGIGTIRDAISDLWFPGTSTLQRRLKYMLFIPWIYAREEIKKTPSRDFGAAVHGAEIKLIDVLANSDDPRYVIGERSREKLQRMPSSIYWVGLERWGICRQSLSQDQYHRYMDAYYRLVSKDKSESEEITGPPIERNWDPGLPAPPYNFPECASFHLTSAEAAYLCSKMTRLRVAGKPTLLSFLAEKAKAGQWLIDTSTEHEWPFIWSRPDLLTDLDPERKSWVEHGRCFSECMHGGALLYNLMLAEASNHPQKSEWVATYERRFEKWIQILKERNNWRAWDLGSFWRLVEQVNPRIASQSLMKAFVETWAGIVRSAPTDSLRASQDARRLIRGREERLKHGKARLTNTRPLELWTGASGAGQLAFRWWVVRMMLDDLALGFAKGEK